MSRVATMRWRLGMALLGFLAALCGVAMCPPAKAAEKSPIAVAPASALYRHRVEQAVARAWGVEGSSARLAAQLHQESAFKANARSPVGAQGIGQFMPSTAKWITTIYPDELDGFDPWNAQQAILAAALYDKWLLDRVGPIGQGLLTACSRWAFVLRAYNGGETALLRERALARKAGANANDWKVVAGYRSRAEWAHRENVNYPQRILLRIEPAYLAAGWPGGPACN